MVPPAARRSAFALLILLSACEGTEPAAPVALTPDWTERGAWTGRHAGELESPGSEEYPPFLAAQAPMARELPERVRVEGMRYGQPLLLLLHPDCVAGDRGTIGCYRDGPPQDETARFVRLLSFEIDAARRLARPWVEVRADRRVPWERVSRWIRILGHEPPGAATLLFRSPTSPGGGRGVLVADLRPVATPSPAEVRLRALTSVPDPEIAVEVGESTWTFPGGPPYAGEDRVRRANEHWRAIRAALEGRASPDRRRIGVEVDDRAPWAYVVQVLSIAAASGTAEVSLPPAGLGLELRLDEGDADAAQALRRVAGGAPFGIAPVAWIFLGLVSGSVAGALLFLVRSGRRAASSTPR